MKNPQLLVARGTSSDIKRLHSLGPNYKNIHVGYVEGTPFTPEPIEILADPNMLILQGALSGIAAILVEYVRRSQKRLKMRFVHLNRTEFVVDATNYSAAEIAAVLKNGAKLVTTCEVTIQKKLKNGSSTKGDLGGKPKRKKNTFSPSKKKKSG